MHQSELFCPQWPVEYVLGSTDPERDAAFIGIFGFEARRLPDMDRAAALALYGIDRSVRQIAMAPVDGGRSFRLVETDNQAAALEPFELGPQGVDIYTRNLDAAITSARAIGATPGLPTPYWVYGQMIVECRILAPQADFGVHAVESNFRFPGILDSDPERFYSDIATFVWFVDVAKRELDLKFWRDEMGLSVQAYGIEFEDDAMGRLMGLPRGARMGSDMYVDRDMTRRLELLYYTEETGQRRPDWPLRSGFHAVTFAVTDLDVAMAALPSASFGQVASVDTGAGLARAVSAESPAGVRFELTCADSQHSNETKDIR